MKIQIWQGKIYQTNELYLGAKTAAMNIKTILKAEKKINTFLKMA